MPTYDYECSGCGQAFEVFQRMSDEPLSNCPDCGAAARRRISGGAGFIFKGEGFYITDHRSREYRDKAAADAGKEPAAAAGAKTSGSDAPAKKSEEGTASSSSSSDSGTKASGGGSGESPSVSATSSRSKSGSGQ
jgi:putative FmdB family regulatory protein